MNFLTGKREIAGLRVGLFALVASVIAAATPLVLLDGIWFAQHQPSLRTLTQIGLFLACAIVADFRPVPLDERGNEVSIAFVFITAARLIFGWRVGIPVAAISILVPELVARKPILRALFNSAAYALAAGAMYFPRLLLGPITSASTIGVLVGGAFIGGVLFLLVNVSLVAAAVSLAQRQSYRRVFATNIRNGGSAFAIMASLAALIASLWVLDAALIGLLAGPLVLLILYQRSSYRSRLATRDANTDNLTGLGNHRSYQSRLQETLTSAARSHGSFSLCLIDCDSFKAVNDQFGHLAGDEVLVRLAEHLRSTNQSAFRFGGDEFALIVEGDERVAVSVVESVQLRLLDGAGAPPITVSAGIATYPTHAVEADELHAVADGALVWSKRNGKDRASIYGPGRVWLRTAEDLEREVEKATRLRAATNLVRFVDAQDPSTAHHSEVVADLAAAIGVELGLEEETVEKLRLAGLLHDLGKIGVPGDILRAPRSLTNEELIVIRRHPEIGWTLLDGVDVTPVNDWILHHHERWDGRGYPKGLAGEEIPLGARIVHVADAFEAMTAARPYSASRPESWALEELRKNAGTQFDPTIVEVFREYLARREEPSRALTA